MEAAPIWHSWTCVGLRAFLGSRSQRIVIDGEESESLPVTSGVPQGSVLGPILFLIYINDLPNEVCSQVRLFADDTALYLTLESEDDSSILQNDLNILSAWETRWDMGFNPSKCQVLHRASTFTRVNGSVSCLCNKRLQKWPTV